jgi:hypothetical protein
MSWLHLFAGQQHGCQGETAVLGRATSAAEPGYLPMDCPARRKGLKFAMEPRRAGQESAEMARLYVAMGKYGLPMNIDSWDGYQAEREQVSVLPGWAGGLVGLGSRPEDCVTR